MARNDAGHAPQSTYTAISNAFTDFTWHVTHIKLHIAVTAWHACRCAWWCPGACSSWRTSCCMPASQPTGTPAIELERHRRLGAAAQGGNAAEGSAAAAAARGYVPPPPRDWQAHGQSGCVVKRASDGAFAGV